MSGIKHDQGKPRPSLLPADALMECAKVMEFGAQKYQDNNWRKGLKISRLMDASDRHSMKFRSHLEDDNDDESGICHLAHKIVNDLMALQFILEKREELDDRYKGESNV